MTGGCWNAQEAQLHINSLEMMAAFFAIKAFAKECQQITILLLTDNISVVAHINKMGGTKSQLLTSQVKDLWAWCLQRQISVTAQHLPGLDNVTADYLSRHLTDRTDWMLDPSIFQCLETIWGPLQVDLFATRFTRQLHRFYSWRPDPEAEATRRSGTELVEYQEICTPSMVSNFTCFVESSVRQGNNSINHSLVAHPSMVSNVAGTTSGLPSPITPGTANNCSLPQLCGSSTGDSTPTGRLEGLRQRLRAGKISEGAIDLIFCSWREKTNSNYNSAWRSWESWCTTQTGYFVHIDLTIDLLET